ncbi:NAD(P)H-quinone oxidoreductase [Jeongeupia sp. USM3]|uniref:NAD(P)H-quinone oxidoreductase n=1 Tax=Jeongeupia sp. USM3 TaxID=1906741 RepID=UPI0009F1C1F1|nr:NAD(P)H-quinone oxidoreductase [Jeongeupia sp. USM3]
MNAILPENYPQLVWGTLPRPVAGPGQLLVRVRAAGINRADLVQAAGHYPPPPGESTVLGLEIAGEVVAVGDGADGFAVGDAVFGLVPGGGYAEYCVLDALLAVRKPEALDWFEAASLPEVWMTVWLNLVELGELQAGQRLLVHAGASGIGAAAIQLGKRLGADVVVTIGSKEKADWCTALGADRAINYREQDFVAEVKAGGGADLILDTVGGDYLGRDQLCLNRDGRIIVIGLLRGKAAELNLGLLLVKRQRVQGSALRSQPLAVKAKLANALATQLLPDIIAGRLKPSLDRVFDIADVRAAHAYVADNRNQGKVVLRLA